MNSLKYPNFTVQKTGLISRDSIILLRIPFSLYLVPVFLLALSQSTVINWPTTVISFVIIHLLVYPSSNGYNSYIDQDKGSIGGLLHPPQPKKELFFLTILLDALALVLSLVLVSELFALMIGLYILASRAYSAPFPRLKKFPFAGFLTVVLFQGAFTYLMSVAGIAKSLPAPARAQVWLLVACSLQIAGAYPLTQIYQHNEDRANGVRSISILLGIKGTFIFTGLMFALCNLCYFLYFESIDSISSFAILQLFFVPVVFYFTWWFRKVLNDPEAADFFNTMRMNRIASVCMSSCFLVFLILRLH